jgi:hypothetical protein
LGKFLLRHGRRPEGLKAWTKKYLEWIKTHVHFDQAALEVTLADDRDSASARAIVETIDLQGVVVGSRTGSANFVRIPFEPLE